VSLRIVAATLGHAHLVATNMRETDRQEIIAGWGKQPKEAIIECINSSPTHANTVFYGLEVLAMYGLADQRILGGAAEIWCFGTTAIDRHRIAFARVSKRVVWGLLSQCPMLTNLVDIGDARALKWLEFLGATYVLEPRELGGKLFQQFILAGEQKPCRQG
jgi:hypothetical protein